MKVVLFYHSLVSDWNHGNAHFLRGIATELLARGHQVEVFEERNAWSVENLLREHGKEPLQRFRSVYPQLHSVKYQRAELDLDQVLAGAGLVLVHEWNDPQLVNAVGSHHLRAGGYRLFFHDTHHRMVTDSASMEAYDLEGYDGVLAYGEALRQKYAASGKVRRAWTWHEAADVRVFYPREQGGLEGDLVWIGNWGDGERSAELNEFLIEPSRSLNLRTRVYGVRYPAEATEALAKASIEYGGWLPNFEAPETFARFKFTVHVPRRPYANQLPGIPTIRPFEAMACGIPLVCSFWDDSERLFTPGRDFLVARNGREMRLHLAALQADPGLRAELAANGLNTIRARHTCAHRANQLLTIEAEVRGATSEQQGGEFLSASVLENGLSRQLAGQHSLSSSAS